VTTRPLTVVKCGGNPSVDAANICADVARLVREGQSVLLVHGGSGEIARLAGKLGVPQRTLVAPDKVSTRYTDAATLEVVILALAGGVKPRIVAELSRLGVPSVGLTGLDGGMLRARRKSAVRSVVDGRTTLVRDNLSGRLSEVRTELAETLLRSGFVPVVSPPAIDEHDHPVNVDADRVAAALAVALGADQLVLLTGTPGVLADPDDDTSVLSTYKVPATGAPGRFAGGGMALKLVAAREALAGGVASVRIADGRIPNPVSRALAGSGTTVTMTCAGSATNSPRDTLLSPGRHPGIEVPAKPGPTHSVSAG
jgi:acetylglutamate/LysW-gamma-L-alpha-aminoadipate kinase